MEIAFPLINNGAAILGASFIINAMFLRFEARHDSVIGRNEMPVVA